MSEDPAELERFYDETVAPLSAYDEQYETDLVTTVEAYLDNDGNVTADGRAALHPPAHGPLPARAGEELCGHDITSTEGREKLGLGLKAMRVLGIAPPARPGDASRARRPAGPRCGARPRSRPPGAIVRKHQWGVVQWQ